MDRYQEIREAIEAADVALAHLKSAQRYLDSAGSWGVWDLLGGGFFLACGVFRLGRFFFLAYSVFRLGGTACVLIF